MVTITGITLTPGRPNKAGNRIIAFFDAQFAGLRLNGCALMWTAKNALIVSPPRMEDPEAMRRSIIITDAGLRHALAQAALEAYHRLGGTEAEWVPRPAGLEAHAAVDKTDVDRDVSATH